MFLRGVFQFKTMRRICLKEYAKYGFVKAPSRKTIRERFKKLPALIEYILPKIAIFCYKNFVIIHLQLNVYLVIKVLLEPKEAFGMLSISKKVLFLILLLIPMLLGQNQPIIIGVLVMLY